ncbi:hypothetical protein MRB53_008454 [Persea americana]|uniref:Uncharacterized protein n=1 Tax=Persea americana TaxID=3435 RepID=A0ACC2MLR6_PERAE|nr:hypothetical protein MRB53_008454 [Persea americana]
MSELEIVDSFNAIEQHLLEEIQAELLASREGLRKAVCLNLHGLLVKVICTVSFIEFQSVQSGKGNADSALACQKLKGNLHTVFNELPKDMQQLLISNPQHAALLQGGL